MPKVEMPPSTKPDQIAERLRVTRAALDRGSHGQQKLYADDADIAPNTYNQWEAGNRPEIDGALKLCVKYHLTLDWIYLGNDSCMPSHLVRRIAEIRAVEQAAEGAEAPTPKKSTIGDSSKAYGIVVPFIGGTNLVVLPNERRNAVADLLGILMKSDILLT